MTTAASSGSVSDGREFLNAFYIGMNIENVLYGIELLLYFKTMRKLLSRRGAHKKSNLFYALFSTVMLFSVTVWVVTEVIFGQQIWLPESDYPGGPYAFLMANLSVWYMEWSRIEIIVLQLMTDALMIYRCRMIWNSNHAVIVPVILWLATLALGILVAWANRLPGVNFDTGVSAQFSLAYWSISVFLNTTLTCMICYRVMRHGRTVQERLGREYASIYFAVVTIVIESVLPYTLSGIAFLVSLGVGSPTFVTFICVYVLMMCISPQMLILRVIGGEAWDNGTFNRKGTTIKFNPVSGDMSGSNMQTPSSLCISDAEGKTSASEV